MQINSLQSVGAAQQATRTSAVKAPAVQTTAHSQPVVDQLDFSVEAQELLASQSASSSNTEIRADRVATIRQQIADGTYETPEKLSAALDRLLDSFA
jgi:negative regulator of flagellin synthesis FlgM